MIEINCVLEQKNAIEAYTSFDGFGKLTTSAGKSIMKIENKEVLFEVMGRKSFIELANFTMTDLKKELGNATMQTLQKDGIVNIETGAPILKYNQPK